MGSFLKGCGTKWKKKKPKTNCESFIKEELTNSWVHGGGGGGGAVKVQVYAAPMHDEYDVEASHDFLHLQCEVEFDPVKDYAQVLAEARTHLKFAKPSDHPCLHSTSSQNHLDAYRELHSALAKPANKPSRIWRYFLFWQKPSNQQVEAEFESIFSTPPHPSFKQSRNDTVDDKGRRARGGNKLSMSKCFGPTRKSNSGPLVSFGGLRPTSKGISGPLNSGPRPSRKNNSGPLYTDGLPSGPYNIRHTKKSHSGPLGAMSSNHCHDNPSSYELLHRRPLSSPVYSC